MKEPKSEIRNPKEYRMPKSEQPLEDSAFWGWGDEPLLEASVLREDGLRNSAFGFVSDFGLRISDFRPQGRPLGARQKHQRGP
jgi:hypothetical protein